MQASLFERPAVDDWFDSLPDETAPSELGDPDGLRWYQREAVIATMKGFETLHSQLIVMATGLGKTQTFGAIAKHWDGPVLVLAHREELTDQAMKRIERMTGEYVELEQNILQSSTKTRIVVASVQSLNAKRLQRLGKDRFSLIITDEAHHAPAASYQRVYDWFDSAKHLGVTATPDRTDEKALGKIFDEVSYVFDIQKGVENGYLVRPTGQLVELGEIDLSGVHAAKTEGGLNLKELDEAMLRAVEGIVQKTLELEPNRTGIGFMPGVRTAEHACNRMNHLKPGSSAWISGDTDPDERKEIIRQFREGRLQYLWNCMVATEGFDAPNCDLIILGRPTKSRSLYAQMAGRGFRVLPGIVDDIHGPEGAQARAEAIAKSAKPDCMILDFVGNSGRHELITATDILGGNFTDAEVKEAKKQAKKRPGSDQLELLKAAREELRKLAAVAKGVVKAEVKAFNPFKTIGLGVNQAAEATAIKFGEQPLTDGQFDALVRAGFSKEDANRLTKTTASRILKGLAERRTKHLATYKQLKQLERYGITDPNIPFERASAAITYIAQKGWGKVGAVDPHALDSIIRHGRETQ